MRVGRDMRDFENIFVQGAELLVRKKGVGDIK